ncbi:protein TSSC4 [Hippoglossus hippoglossus]|uniref:protein TSSC4 n=1 Tax=Hippoglossus hippoglossus TaxID=8267 RepID=UPI00148DF9A8|nr:protein TSSC4 [Hippoglossus hippoglossus]
MSDQKSDHSDVDDLSDSDESEPEEKPNTTPFDQELDHDDHDDGDFGGVVLSAPAAQMSFSLRGGGSAFSNRKQSIFDKLDNAVQRTSSSTSQDNITDGVFALPQPPCPSLKRSQPQSTSSTPPKKKEFPDYMAHPERWTHYSLEDVTETSDRDNSKAAHQFLSSLKKDRECDSSCNIQEKMIFSRPSKLPKDQTADQPLAVRANKRGMHLSHLEDEEGWVEARKKEKSGGKGTEQEEEEIKERKTDQEKNIRVLGQPEEEKKKQMPKEREEGTGVKTEVAKPSFTTFRKPKSKNYRKSTEEDDN